MVTCPRCQNSVDEKQRVSCPVCMALLTAPPALPGMSAPAPPTSGAYSPARPPQMQPPAMPYAPPPGSPYPPPAPTAYAPPPGSPYAQGPGVASTMMPGTLPLPPSVPGYGPAAGMRTTLTGEVVQSAPAAGYAPPYPQGGYTPHPGAAPYASGGSASSSTPSRSTAGQSKGGRGMNWGWAGGGAFTVFYIVSRVGMLLTRLAYPSATVPSNNFPSTPPSAYAPGGSQSYSSMPSIPANPSPAYRYNAPPMQQPLYRTPDMPMRSSFPPRFPTRFQPNGMPQMPQMPQMPGRPNFQPNAEPPGGPTPPPPSVPETPVRSSPPDQGSFGVPLRSQLGNP